MQYLTFAINNELYGVPIEVVREINRVSEITPVPKTPVFVKGVMNLRGKIIPVVSLRVKFDLPEKEYDRDTCVIVIDRASTQIGIIVDSVKEVIDLAQDKIETPPVLGQSEKMQYVKGIGKQDDKVIILVDIVSAFAVEAFTEIKNELVLEEPKKSENAA